ncbi:MAG: guanine deaminase [Planktomarina sp.]
MKTLLKGQTLQFLSNPFRTDWAGAVRHEPHGAVVVDHGQIVDIGLADAMVTAHPGAVVKDHGKHLILPGFVDAHVHYPQTRIIASWGKRLIDWLNTYTFPEEMRLADPSYATTVAGDYLDLVTARGTTTVASFCTSSPVSVDALFTAAESRNMRIVAGKTCMDRNAPDGLCDTAQRGYDESKALIDRWHGMGRAMYAITPRFAPTSTPEQLQTLGELWSEYPDCLMQTHLSEQHEEIAWVRDLFPEATDYLDIYDRFGLLGRNGLYGHSIHLTDREKAKLAEVDAAVVHCPTSNTFIGSGLFDTMGLTQTLRVALATDTGGGSSFSMLRTMAAAYEVAQLRGDVLHPAQMVWMATAGGAEAMGLNGVIGTLNTGAEADFVVLDLESTDAIAQRARNADGFWDLLFPTLMMGDERAVAATYIAGVKV